MPVTEKQSALERVLLARWFLFLLLGLLIIIAVGYARAYYADYQVRQEIAKLQDEVRSLENKKFTSLQLLDRSQTENFLEEKAKTELNLKKPGENVLIIPEITQETTVPATTPVDEAVLSNPQKWWYYFTAQFK
ncbi:MAG: septum formation initiator family protein [Candidatus Magasanikbacteria bacterium]|nr:septum formation initiator family protein [Candidatus Magasanikbacteria bacterium]